MKPGSLVVFGATVLLYLLHGELGIGPGLVALLGASAALLWVRPTIEDLVASVEWDVLIALRAVLTMAGIAGVVLTIGMAVDSNIIIFERIKEEKRAGKPSLAAVRAGYERSLPVITDTNAVTFVTALILLLVGSGPFVGFAITLALGIVATVYCALVPSRFLLERGGFWRFIPVRLPEGTK